MAKSLGAAGGDFAKRLGKIGTSVQRGRADVRREMAMEAKKAQQRVIAADTGGDSRLSGVGKRGAKVGARFDVVGQQTHVYATGPLQFVAHPMSPHRIPKVRKRGRKRVAVIPGVGVRAHAMHPGTKGKDTWRRGVKAARPKVTKVAEGEWSRIIRRAFK